MSGELDCLCSIHRSGPRFDLRSEEIKGQPASPERDGDTPLPN
jgi:hypothetical protein